MEGFIARFRCALSSFNENVYCQNESPELFISLHKSNGHPLKRHIVLMARMTLFKAGYFSFLSDEKKIDCLIWDYLWKKWSGYDSHLSFEN